MRPGGRCTKSARAPDLGGLVRSLGSALFVFRLAHVLTDRGSCFATGA